MSPLVPSTWGRDCVGGLKPACAQVGSGPVCTDVVQVAVDGAEAVTVGVRSRCGGLPVHPETAREASSTVDCQARRGTIDVSLLKKGYWPRHKMPSGRVDALADRAQSDLAGLQVVGELLEVAH